MQKYVFDISFVDEDGTSISIIEIETPDDVTKKTVLKAIKKCHEQLWDDEEFDYGIGSDAALFDYVCNKHGWKWRRMQFDGSLVLSC